MGAVPDAGTNVALAPLHVTVPIPACGVGSDTVPETARLPPRWAVVSADTAIVLLFGGETEEMAGGAAGRNSMATAASVVFASQLAV
jgi:hypothetical protein